MQKKVWFITGCSTGFGRAIAKAAIEAGNKVVVTARNTKTIEDISIGKEDTVLALQLDVTKKEQITAAVNAAIEKFGRIDVLVNNAGIGYMSSVEEAVPEEVQKMFNINFWGLMDVTNAVMPIMRTQKSGHIFNFSSIGGLAAFPSVGYYNATKFAVEAITECLSQEAAAYNIKFTLIEPGSFRTDWAGRSSVKTIPQIDEYKKMLEPAFTTDRSGTESGNPAKAAAAVLKIADTENPPLRLLLGKDAYFVATDKFNKLLASAEQWKDLTFSTDFDE